MRVPRPKIKKTRVYFRLQVKIVVGTGKNIFIFLCFYYPNPKTGERRRGSAAKAGGR